MGSHHPNTGNLLRSSMGNLPSSMGNLRSSMGNRHNKGDRNGYNVLVPPVNLASLMKFLKEC